MYTFSPFPPSSSLRVKLCRNWTKLERRKLKRVHVDDRFARRIAHERFMDHGGIHFRNGCTLRCGSFQTTSGCCLSCLVFFFDVHFWWLVKITGDTLIYMSSLPPAADQTTVSSIHFLFSGYSLFVCHFFFFLTFTRKAFSIIFV